MATWEVKFEDKEGFMGRVGFGTNPPYQFIGLYSDLVFHLKELQDVYGVTSKEIRQTNF